MRWLFSVAMVLLSICGAKANTVFYVSSQNGLYSGTLTVDTLNGTVVSADVTVAGGSADFTNFVSLSQGSVSETVELAEGVVRPNTPITAFSFDFVDGGTLVGFNGGTITNAFAGVDCSQVPSGCNAIVELLGQGALSSQVAAVPEPSTWAMMILGFVGVGAMTYRRRKSAMLAA
jgi:PEP-CTERM motif